MWRAFALAMGLTLIVSGAGLFFVEEIEIRKVWSRSPAPPAAQTPFQNISFGNTPPAATGPQTVLYQPPDWMPWSLVAAGTIITLYTFTLRSRPGP